MPAQILVAYASTLGSTPEIAQAVGKELQSAGYTVDVADIKTVLSLEGYSAVVIGWPLYTGFAGYGDIGNFVKTRFPEPLMKIPVAIFAIGLLREGTQPNNEYVMNGLKTALSPIIPATSVLFCGILDSKKAGFWTRHFGDIRNIPSSDYQDWDKIRVWARELPALLKI